MSLDLKEPGSENCVGSARKTAGPAKVGIEQLIELSIKGLGSMFDPGSGQFCYRLARTSDGLRQEGLSPRYTAMTLLGLCEFEKAGGPPEKRLPDHRTLVIG